MLIKRISTFTSHFGLSYNKFEKSINTSRGTISRALKHNKTIGSNVVESILENYPELSAEWLLRGKGEMLLADSIGVQKKDSSQDNLPEKLILEIWEKKYGPELANIKRQLEILYRDKLDHERNSSLEERGVIYNI